MNRILPAAVLLVAACAACGHPAGGAQSRPKPPPHTSTTAVPTTTVPTTTTAPPPVPADGTDLAACADGSCEIAVSGPVSIPLKSALHVGPVGVTAVRPGEVDLTIPLSGSSFSSDCAPATADCGSYMSVSTDGGGVATATPHSGETFILNQLQVTVEYAAGGSAVLKLATT